jgi:hypothetical protein
LCLDVHDCFLDNDCLNLKKTRATASFPVTVQPLYSTSRKPRKRWTASGFLACWLAGRLPSS